MARRRGKTETSMFPFLSVLCTVIGVMVLFIVLIMSTRVISADKRFRPKKDSPDRASPGLPDALAEGIDERTFRSLEQELEGLARRLEQREAQRDVLDKKLAGLEDLLEFKKTEMFVQVSRKAPPRELAEPEPVAMVPDEGYEVPLHPVFVEVDLEGYTVHPEGTKYPAIVEKKSEGKESQFDAVPELAAYLKSVDRKKRKDYLVFLIHPNGIEPFQNIRVYLLRNHKDVRMGWEPFSRSWIVARPED